MSDHDILSAVRAALRQLTDTDDGSVSRYSAIIDLRAVENAIAERCETDRAAWHLAGEPTEWPVHISR